MSASNYLENAILDYFFRNESATQPTTLYLALYLNNPTDDDTGTEVTGIDYDRQEVTFGTVSQVGGKAVIKNTNKIEFEIAGSDWGEISHWAIRDASTAGNMLAYGAFSRMENVQTGNRFTIEVSNLEVTVD